MEKLLTPFWYRVARIFFLSFSLSSLQNTFRRTRVSELWRKQNGHPMSPKRRNYKKIVVKSVVHNTLRTTDPPTRELILDTVDTKTHAGKKPEIFVERGFYLRCGWNAHVTARGHKFRLCLSNFCDKPTRCAMHSDMFVERSVKLYKI